MSKLEQQLQKLHDEIEGRVSFPDCCRLMEWIEHGAHLGAADRQAKIVAWLRNASREMTKGSYGRAPILTVRSAFASEFADAVERGDWEGKP